jgi:hypothetical protein
MTTPPTGSPGSGGTSLLSALLFAAVAALLVWKVVLPLLSGGGC